MKILKKSLAVLLVLISLLALVPATVSASVTAPVADLLKLTFGPGQTVSATSSLGNVAATIYKGSSTVDQIKEANFYIGNTPYTATAFVNSAQGYRIELPTDAYIESLTTTISNGFSIELGVTIPEVSSGAQSLIGSSAAGGFGVYLTNAGELKFQVGVTAGANNGNYSDVYLDETPTAGTYCHIVAVFDPENDTHSIYLNGELSGTRTFTGDFKPGSYSGNISVASCATSATSYSAYGAKTATYTCVNMYNDPLSAAQAEAAYEAHLESLSEIVTEVPDEGEFTPVLRFAVASDLQKTPNSADSNSNAANMIAQAYRIAQASSKYNKLDAVLIAGDMGEGDNTQQYTEAYNALTRNLDADNTSLLAIMGNHEYYSWRWSTNVDKLSGAARDAANKEISQAGREEFLRLYGDHVDYETGDSSDGYYDYVGFHKVINGYHFIGVSSDWENRWAYDYNTKTMAWLKEQMDEAVAEDPTKPVFIVGHVSGENTVAGSGDDLFNERGSAPLNNVLKDYPQAVMFGGHSHVSLMTEGSIHQDKYTNINTGSLNNTTSQRIKDADGNSKDIAGTRQYNADLFYIVEVDKDGNTRLTTYDISQNKSVWKPIDLVAPFNTTANFKYTEALQFSSVKDIKFPETAQLQVHAQKNLAQFTFDPADPYLDENSLLATAYYWEVYKGEQKVSSGYLANTFAADGMLDDKLSGAVGNLTPGTEYTLKVYGANPKYDWILTDASVYSKKPLTATFTTQAGDVAFGPDILDLEIDAQNKTVTDKSGNMTATVNGTPEFSYDDTIDMDIITLSDGATVKLANYIDDAFAMGYAFTTEAYFRLDNFDIPSSRNYNAIISSMQASGFGFEFLKGGQVQYAVHDGSYRTVKKTVEEDKFYHWVCSYDGQLLTCYVNGQKLGSVAAAAPLRFPDDAAKVLFLGADTSASGTPENTSDISVALTRIYNGAATAEQAAALWDAVKDGRDQEVYDDSVVDPELLSWVYYDDCDTEHVKFVGGAGTVHDDHTNCTVDGMLIDMDGDKLQYFKGGHLINNTSHNIIGNIKAVFEFTGCAFKIRTQYRGPVTGGNGDTLDVYIDGNFYGSVTGFSGQHDTSLYEVLISGLSHGDHVVEILAADGRIAIDSFGAGSLSNVTTYDITVNAGEGGKANITTATILEGGKYTVNFTPDAGYMVDDVKVDGVSVGAVTKYEFTNIKANHTVEVTFRKAINANTCSVKLSATSYKYDGAAKKPTVTVKNSEGKTLVNGTDYTVTYATGRKAPGKYKVTVNFKGNYGGTKELYFTIAPLAPSKITVGSRNATSIKLTWPKAVGATGYRVYKYDSKTGTYKTVATTSNLSYTVKELNSATQYKFRIKSYTKLSDGTTIWSGYRSLSAYTAPKAPSKLSVSSRNTSSIKLSWPKATGATGYRIYKYDPETGTYKTVATTTSLSYTVKSLKSATNYKFRIKSYKKLSDGTTIWSGYRSLSAATRPIAPSISSISSPSKGKVTLKWTNIARESGYQIYYATSKTGTYKLLDTTKVNDVSETCTGLTSGRTYYFKVRAYKIADGYKIYSSYSPVKAIKIK